MSLLCLPDCGVSPCLHLEQLPSPQPFLSNSNTDSPLVEHCTSLLVSFIAMVKPPDGGRVDPQNTQLVTNSSLGAAGLAFTSPRAASRAL